MFKFKFQFLVLILTIIVPTALSKFEAIEPLLKRLDSKKVPPSVQEAAAKGVLKRLIPTHLSSFEFNIVSKDACGGVSCFLINNHNKSGKYGPEIIIRGTTAVEIASGLHWYLKYWCGAHVSWDKTGGIQTTSIPKPGSLPLLKDEVLIKRPVPWNYYQNVVTSSYSYVWWDWERWEKEVDWMALQGVNLPLAFTGQEAIWQKVFKDFNISSEDLNNFFGGPAFLAWARMGNLHGWGGPLSQNWLDQQLVLQKQIISRMLELGMTPVLPSFAGNVPAALAIIFPKAKITRLGDCDTFNENTPPTNDTTYISTLGAAVYKAMSKGDSNAVWLMQGWLFYSDSSFWKPPQMKALLHSVPFGKMIVLDLFADVKPIWKTSFQFYGTPYIWCMLHNFGGNIEMYGVLDAISSGPVDARVSANSTMVGVGMCMEGIEHNPVVYELMPEMAFRDDKVQVLEWLKSYSRRRYGKADHQVEAAWEILYHTIYNCTDGIADHNHDYIVVFPDWDPTTNFKSGIPDHQKKIEFLPPGSRRYLFQETPSEMPKVHLWYSPDDVIKALQLFLAGGKNFAGSLTYRYDLVDLTRQVLSKLANQVYINAVTSFQKKDIDALRSHSNNLLQLIKDIDVLLASDDNLLVGTWLESAKKLAVTASEIKQYEWNARTQVTMWYDTNGTTQSKLHDYANKFWSGIVENYYLPRAATYFSHLSESLKQNKKFNLVEWRKQWISHSNKWQEGNELYPVKAKGDALAISQALYEKYFAN
ncbi:PREDICTED: alpha-N-acetylglucosaminidase isoform X2 [Lupinus angustifolius]|uniref:alpha-N-acetylglucosaminidase isoform X2 n=1 Tax=Lupinus angustifolius TaxID=3871 RepID=UPI00092F9909|nr:PREDICTED: alpha-N-acetylglucosaminidase isoform X2 [Lupinus angustifolius]